MSQVLKRVEATGVEAVDFLPAGSDQGMFPVIVDSYPDEANRETINRIAGLVVAPTSWYTEGSWVSDRDGYAVLQATGTPAAGRICSFIFSINGITREASGTYTSRSSLTATLKVRKDDLVTIRVMTNDAAPGTLTLVSGSCYWEPAIFKTVATPQYQVEVGTDYSTDEKPVMVKDSITGEVRQKLDVDGRPVWERTFTGTVTAALNTDSAITLLSGTRNGWATRFLWQLGGGDGYWYGAGPTYGASSLSIYSYAMFRAAGTLGFLSRSQATRDGTTNSGYLITAQYTKA